MKPNTTQKVARQNIVKAFFQIPKISKNPIAYFQEILDKNNGVVSGTIPYKFLLTDRPELIRQMLQKNHKNYRKPRGLRFIAKKYVGNGLLISDGAYWLAQRRAIQKGFHKEKLEKISKTMVSEINHYMETKLNIYAHKEEEIDLVKEMTHLAFRIVTKGLFSETVENHRLEVISTALSNLQQFLIDRARKPFLIPWHFFTKKEEKLQKKIDESKSIVLEIIHNRKKSGSKNDDLLDMLLESRYENGEKMSDQQILDECLLFFVAGHETSAMSLTWTWYLLSEHDEIQDKLHHSVIDNLGTKKPSFESLKELGYALQVIEESMRLYPPAWYLVREAIEDDYCNGIPLKKGTDITGFVYGVHHNSNYWKDPETFDPERFSPERKKQQKPYTYIPFGGGPRYCIGNNFAIMEMQLILAMFVKKYEFIKVKQSEPVGLNPLLNLRPKNSIKVVVKKREL